MSEADNDTHSSRTVGTLPLDVLWEAAQRVMEATGIVERATDETARREWAAVARELIRLGLPTYDRHGPSTPGRAWWTAQNDTGRIIGRWAESYEEAVIELGAGFRSRIVWCVADTGLDIRNRYPRGKQGEPCIHPVTAEPIPGPDFAPITPLF